MPTEFAGEMGLPILSYLTFTGGIPTSFLFLTPHLLTKSSTCVINTHPKRKRGQK